jgi:outer membrane receptor protein involved in Fe transport
MPLSPRFAFLVALSPLVVVLRAQTTQSTAPTSSSSAEEIIALEKIEVSGTRSVSMNSIDRKVYNVGKDITSITGSASDLLNNVPSISVDIDGALSLRGSENVTILIDGRPSASMGKNRAAVLEQMPADSIERIEVITNPSAKYKPDGTSGIINIITKKKIVPGFSGTLSVNAGNDDRANASLGLSHKRERTALVGSYGFRQDDRLRRTTNRRSRTDLSTGATTEERQTTEESSRPLSHIFRSSLTHDFSKSDQLELSGDYSRRTLTRSERSVTLTPPHITPLVRDSERLRLSEEYENDLELSAHYQHTFGEDDHAFSADLTASKSTEQEDNRFTTLSRLPLAPPSFDNTFIHFASRSTEITAEYSHPLNDDSRFETGYSCEANSDDMDFRGEYLDPTTNRWTTDTAKTNRFIFDETVHALYATYAHSLGKFGFLAGLRAEQAFIDSRLFATDTTIPNNYFRLYPSLHLSYAAAEDHELQLNYSHRVRRPEGDDLNPFPEYRDPQKISAGNPFLKPEDIHSIELGHQFSKDETSVVTTAYYRYRYNSLTEITRPIDPTTQLTTKANLGSSRALGLELAADSPLTSHATINVSANAFLDTIDASNLGYSRSRSAFSWIAKASATLRPAQNTLVQITTNYTSDRLTPQGHKGSSYIVSIGLRQEIWQRKAAIIFTASDIFDSLRERTTLHTTELRETTERRRSPRILYLGVLYKFGQQGKKTQDDALKFDEAF